MTKNIRVSVEFSAVAHLSIPICELNADEYDLSHPGELSQAVDEWVEQRSLSVIVEGETLWANVLDVVMEESQ